jgi:hypothetical protein
VERLSPVHVGEAVELGRVAATLGEDDREEEVGEAVVVGGLGVLDDDPAWRGRYS